MSALGKSRFLVLVLATFGLVASLAGPGPASPGDPWTREEIGKGATSFSSDLRYWVFRTDEKLSSEDTDPSGTGDEYLDFYLYDRTRGTYGIANYHEDGPKVSPWIPCTGGPLGYLGARVSDDGRYVAMVTRSQLVAEDTDPPCWREGEPSDAYVRDMQEGTTTLVSPGGAARSAIFSHGGRFLLVIRVGQPPTLVDPATGEVLDDDLPWMAGGLVSEDGRFIAFDSEAALVPHDDNSQKDVYVFDRVTRELELISIALDGTAGEGTSAAASLPMSYPMSIWPLTSADGRYVLFQSIADDLVPHDRAMDQMRPDGGDWDVFVRDRQTGVTEQISLNAAGQDTALLGLRLGMSGDGRFVTWSTYDPEGDWIGPIPDQYWDPQASALFVHDRRTHVTRNLGTKSGMISADATEFAGGAPCYTAEVHATCTWVDTPYWSVRAGIAEIHATPGVRQAKIHGAASLPGARIADTTDPDDDGGEILPGVKAREVGGELTGSHVSLRLHNEDLLFVLDLAELPGVDERLQPGVPGLVYEVRFNAQGIPHRLRASRAGTGTVGKGEYDYTARASFTLGRWLASLEGSYGEAGRQVWLRLPLRTRYADPLYPQAPRTISLDPGAEGLILSDVQVVAALGDATTGPIEVIDELEMGDVAVPHPTVELGIAPAGTDVADVSFGEPVPFAVPSFTDHIATDHLEGPHDVWGRVCLGDECGVGRAGMDL